MWRIVVATLLYALAVDSRPFEPLEGPLWERSFLQSLKNRQKIFTQRSFPSDEDTYNTDDIKLDLALPRLPQDKRALTMIARWGPFANIGKQRTPIRSNFIDVDTINTQTRARGPGQPLRWG